MPSRSLPTSVSSILPTKSRSCISATVAIVVPSLKVLVRMTELPTLTGTSKTVPAIVAFTMVLVKPASAFCATPSRVMLRWSSAAKYSSWSEMYCNRDFSYASLAITFCASRTESRSKTLREFSRLYLARRTRDSALLSCAISGMTLILAMASPTRTLSPACL